MEELGEGTNLYFKFLKYFMVLFFVASLLSIPIYIIYGSELMIKNDWDKESMFMVALTLANVGPYSI